MACKSEWTGPAMLPHTAAIPALQAPEKVQSRHTRAHVASFCKDHQALSLKTQAFSSPTGVTFPFQHCIPKANYCSLQPQILSRKYWEVANGQGREIPQKFMSLPILHPALFLKSSQAVQDSSGLPQENLQIKSHIPETFRCAMFE